MNLFPGDVPIKLVDESGQRLLGWRRIATNAPLALTLAWLHTPMPRIERHNAVAGPYFSPQPEHLKYMGMSTEALSVEDK